jgi:hypothetical protein
MRQLTLVLGLTIGLPLLQQSELEAVLRTAADYIAQYEREITAVSAEEDYVQRAPTDQGSRPGVTGSAESLTVRRLVKSSLTGGVASWTALTADSGTQ